MDHSFKVMFWIIQFKGLPNFKALNQSKILINYDHDHNLHLCAG